MDDNVIGFRPGPPSARLKSLDWKDKRANCRHRRIEVWTKEPIIECADCGAVVDPYAWMRATIGEWKEMVDAVKYQRRAIEGEIEELKKGLRILRKEYRDEREKQEAANHLMIMPPRRSTP